MIPSSMQIAKSHPAFRAGVAEFTRTWAERADRRGHHEEATAIRAELKEEQKQ